MNNAVHWAAVEEVLQRTDDAVDGGWTVELEYRVPLEADDEPDLAVVRHDDGFACWLECAAVTRASAVARRSR